MELFEASRPEASASTRQVQAVSEQTYRPFIIVDRVDALLVVRSSMRESFECPSREILLVQFMRGEVVECVVLYDHIAALPLRRAIISS
jgi:hypothetical protein